MEKAQEFSNMTTAGDIVGEVLLWGRHGGAYCSHYQINRIEGGRTYWRPVTLVSRPNGDGTFSTVVEDETIFPRKPFPCPQSESMVG
jgi:hypothetical protein